MGAPLQFAPLGAVGIRDLVLVDIRPNDERFGGLGFVPGSVALAPEPTAAELKRMQSLGLGTTVVLICLAGRRSLEAAKKLRVTSLSGGLLAWRGAELPVAGAGVRWDGEGADASVPPWRCRDIAACFVAETVELALDAELELDPMALFLECCEEARVDPSAPDLAGTLRLLDQTAARTRALGCEHGRIATMIDKTLGRLSLSASGEAGAA